VVSTAASTEDSVATDPVLSSMLPCSLSWLPLPHEARKNEAESTNIRFFIQTWFIYKYKFYSFNPRPCLRILPDVFNSDSTLSRIPLINVLLLGVLKTLEISIYSLIVTLTGIDEKLINSQIANRIIKV